MNLNGKHIAILVDNYFEQAEFEEPLSYLRDAGAEVTIISTGEHEVQGLNHAEKGDRFETDIILDDSSSGDYDALVLPGGALNADHLRMNDLAQQWVRDFLGSGRPLAVICHAPWLLVSADCIEGRRLTSYWTIQDDIRNAGGEWFNEPVVIDDNLITSRQPDDIPQFNEAIAEMLNTRRTVATASAADLPALGSEQELEDELRLRSLGYSPDRDELSKEDIAELLSDDIDETPDEFNPSNIIPPEEDDGND